MKLYAPRYCGEFVCKADRCAHSCCIGWEIDIDSETAEHYQGLKDGYGEKIRSSIDWSETPHFRLGEGERCPHLNERGLCRIILGLGEEYLCEICREHPRFYHDTCYGKEMGLGMACEEACRLILSSDDYGQLVEIGELEGDTESLEVDCVAHRQQIYGVLSQREIPYGERLHRISEAYDVTPAQDPDETWRVLLGGLEYLDASHLRLFEAYTSHPTIPEALEPFLERALAYFVYRHCGEAYDEEEHRASLGLCLFCHHLLASVAAEAGITDGEELAEVARILSEELEYSEENTEAVRERFYRDF